ncbi:MAG: YceI family protein [Chitinophagaceae bacterium]|nr:YceI family protein [Chitinophagaceae bacterium]
MKHFLGFLFLMGFTNWALGQQFIPKDEDSEVKFRIKNFGVNVTGTLKGLEGKISFYADSLAGAHFDVSVKTGTINTGIDQRDNHLQQEEYFDAKKYPTIHFVSTKVTSSTNKEYLFVFGNLTIKDVTKEISFPFKATPRGDDYLFEGEFTLNRRDYNVGGGSITMSDNLTVLLSVLAKKE